MTVLPTTFGNYTENNKSLDKLKLPIQPVVISGQIEISGALTSQTGTLYPSCRDNATPPNYDEPYLRGLM